MQFYLEAFSLVFQLLSNRCHRYYDRPNLYSFSNFLNDLMCMCYNILVYVDTMNGNLCNQLLNLTHHFTFFHFYLLEIILKSNDLHQFCINNLIPLFMYYFSHCEQRHLCYI